MLLYPASPVPYDVRALRVGFPSTLHQNQVGRGQPPSLCLYFEPWPHVERSWTPERFLERILWWLKETALGSLHRADQQLEQFYFDANLQIVVPPDYRHLLSNPGSIFRLEQLWRGQDGPKVLRGSFIERAQTAQAQGVSFDCVFLSVPPILHSPVRPHPYTLGELDAQLKEQGSQVIQKLVDHIKALASNDGIGRRGAPRQTLLVLDIPICRNLGDTPEKFELRGFLISEDLAGIGLASNALFSGTNGKAFAVHLLPSLEQGDRQDDMAGLNEIPLEPIDVRPSLSRESARFASGLSEDGSEFKGVLAGVGALGSFLGDIWAREGWGLWTLVEDDTLRAHNIARHVGKDRHIGFPKTHVVKEEMESNFPSGYSEVSIIPGKITDFSIQSITDVLRSATLLIDATTTLEAPRDLSANENVPRTASVFLTPSGLSAVLLLEDRERLIRISHLEAQYYRAILNQPFGEKHLLGHMGDLWVGAGCRDVSFVLSNELIRFHSALLARRIRKEVGKPEPRIVVWTLDDDTGSLQANEIFISPPICILSPDWKIYWDDGLREKMRTLRSRNLPNETGGILLGYHDMKLKSIHLVDALPAPEDSLADETGFSRGIKDLTEIISTCSKKTARIVDYVGEWHSHPRNASSRPSLLDLKLFAHQARIMANDGLPVLMAIVGEHDERFFLCTA